jgi:hypothetical protein
MQSSENETIQYHFDVFADYHQVYLQDCAFIDELTRVEGRDSNARANEIGMHVQAVLSPDAYARHLGVAHATLCILTARYVTVPLDVEIRAGPPGPEDFAGWDHVVEASLDLPSGCLVVRGPTDGPDEEHRIGLARGLYRARVYYGGVYTVSADELDGEDHYRVALWLEAGPAVRPIVLHSGGSGRW